MADHSMTDPRLSAVMAALDGWEGTKTVESLAREVLAAADAVDYALRPTPTGTRCGICGASTWGLAQLCAVHEAKTRATGKSSGRKEKGNGW